MRKAPITDEEKTAMKMAGLLSDLRLDIERVGIYLARMRPSTAYRRLEILTESAQEEKENNEQRINY